MVSRCASQSSVLSHRVNTLGQDLLRRYGERVHKLAINAGFTCPNRDGSKGRGGCTFCNNVSFSPNARREPDVAQQIGSGRRVLAKRTGARRFIAYFQAYTNTYEDVAVLERLYGQALAEPDVVGLSVGTRPDCVPEPVLDLLARYHEQGHEVWLELGLQSAFDATLGKVNRGHGFAEYRAAVVAARSRGLLHPLHVVKGTRLANQWRRGEYAPLTFDQYVETVVEMVRRTPPEVVYHRLTGTAAESILLAPRWCSWKWRVLNAITRRMETEQAWQGDLLSPPLTASATV